MNKSLFQLFDPDKVNAIKEAGIKLVEKTSNDFNEYIKQMTETTRQTTIRKYNEAHACCPKCGNYDGFSQIAGYVQDPSDPAKIKNMNKAWCSNCKDEHLVDDRVPAIESQ